MNTDASMPSRRFFISRVQTLPLWLGLVLTTSNLVQAQTAAAPAPLTREQVKMERDEFLKTHRYDTMTDNWVMKPEFEAPAGVKSRAEVKADRDEFLRSHRYDNDTGTWVPIKTTGAPAGTRSRKQVREETRQFMRTHRWDDVNQTWQEFKPATKRAKP